MNPKTRYAYSDDVCIAYQMTGDGPPDVIWAPGTMSHLAVHIGARVMAEAAPGEVLASSTVKDLVAGSGLSFRDRGVRALKGVPDEWRLFVAAA